MVTGFTVKLVTILCFGLTALHHTNKKVFWDLGDL